MKKENQIIEKSKLSDLREKHGVVLLTNLKVIQGGSLCQGVRFDSNGKEIKPPNY